MATKGKLGDALPGKQTKPRSTGKPKPADKSAELEQAEKVADEANAETEKKARAKREPMSEVQYNKKYLEYRGELHTLTERIRVAENKARGLRNDRADLYKKVKSKLGSKAVEGLRTSLEVHTPEGEAAWKERLQGQFYGAQMEGIAVGEQANLFIDRRPSDEKAKERGKIDGLAGRDSAENDYHHTSKEFTAYKDGYAIGANAAREESLEVAEEKFTQNLAEHGPPAIGPIEAQPTAH